MSQASYEVLKTAKSALDEGLINQADYDGVKNSFLRAQQIKAGLDAGFIKEAEFVNVKRAFMNSLNLQSTPEKQAPTLDAEPQGPPASNGTAWHAGQATGQAAGPASSSRPSANGPGSGAPVSASRPAPPQAVERSPHPSRTPAGGAPGAPPAPASTAARPAPSTAGAGGGRGEYVPGSNVPRNIPNIGGRRPKANAGTSISGISVSEDAINMYYLLKAKTQYRWTTWMINSAGNEVVIADVGENTSDYQGFLEALPAEDCRYGVYDYQFTNSEGCVFNKIAFVNWAPDAARVKAKMMYASTKDYLKGFLDGLAVELQGSDKEDIQERDMAEAVRSTITRQ